MLDWVFVSSGSVSVFLSGLWRRLSCSGHGGGPMTLGRACGSTGCSPARGGGSSFRVAAPAGQRLCDAGRRVGPVIFTGPRCVVLVARVWPKAGRDFCFRSEYRCRPVQFRVCSALVGGLGQGGERGQAVVAVTRDWRIDAAAARRIVVKETWSVPAGPAWRRAVWRPRHWSQSRRRRWRGPAGWRPATPIFPVRLDEFRFAGAQARGGGRADAGHGGLVLPDRGLRGRPAHRVGGPQRLGVSRLAVEQDSRDRIGFRYVPAAAGQDHVVLGGPQRQPVHDPVTGGLRPGRSAGSRPAATRPR